MQGSTLVPLVNGTETTRAGGVQRKPLRAIPHYGWSPLKSITTASYALIDSPKPELFDRKADPGQRHNLIHEREAVAQDLRWKSKASPTGSQGRISKGPQPMDAEAEQKLRSLGYLGLARSKHGGEPEDRSQRHDAGW